MQRMAVPQGMCLIASFRLRVMMQPTTLHRFVACAQYFTIRSRKQASFRKKYHVNANARPAESSAHFAHPPLRPVAPHRIAKLFPSNKSNTTGQVVLASRHRDEGQIARVQPTPLGESLRDLLGRRDGFQEICYTQRRLRPLARRRARTRRPPFVAMRARKPWHLARLRLFG